MVDNALPEGSYEFEVIKALSDKEAELIATWMSEAFSRTDSVAYLATGKTYAEDPVAHYLYQRSGLDRTAAGGYCVVNKTRTAFRRVFPPGQKDHRRNTAVSTPYDENWNLFLERCGGAEAFKARMSLMSGGVRVELEKRFGDDLGLTHYRSAGMAVHPDCQGKGVGLALHKYIAGQAMQANRKWFFFTVEYNVPYYEKLGCKIVGEKIPVASMRKDERHILPVMIFLLRQLARPNV